MGHPAGCPALAAQVASGALPLDAIDEARFGRELALADLPDPDLFIRTGGDHRISNFLLWNLAYTETHVCDALWPDFDVPQFEPRSRRSRARTPLRPDPRTGATPRGGQVLKQRVLTAIVLVAVLLGVMLGLPAIATVWLLTVLVLIGAWEWAGFIGRAARVARGIHPAVALALVA